MARIFRFMGHLLWALALILAVLWGAFELYYHPLTSSLSDKIPIAIYVLLGLLAVISIWKRSFRPLRFIFLAAFVGLIIQWNSITPARDVAWPAELSRVITYQNNNGIVTVNNVRNFDWHTEENFTERWETRTYKLDELVSADIYVIYWDGPAIAHTIMSFGFAGGDYLAFSIESRHQDKSFSTTEGLFKIDQLLYIAADERDLFTLRHIRKDDPHMYRMRVKPEDARDLFLTYLKNGADIADHPRFYNTITTNCTTEIYDMIKRLAPQTSWNWRILFNGFLPGQLYDTGLVNTNYKLEELQALGQIEPLTLPLPESHIFSEQIRVRPPGPYAAHP